jgi:hypothetical protein
MSMFESIAVACPACGTQVDFDAVQSVNADRRPDLRAAILAGTFVDLHRLLVPTGPATEERELEPVEE